jgi:hypothetical protein
VEQAASRGQNSGTDAVSTDFPSYWRKYVYEVTQIGDIYGMWNKGHN